MYLSLTRLNNGLQTEDVRLVREKLSDVRTANVGVPEELVLGPVWFIYVFLPIW